MGVKMNRQFLVSSWTLSSPVFPTPLILIPSSNFYILKPCVVSALYVAGPTCIFPCEWQWWLFSKQKSSTSLHSPHSDLDCVLLDSLCEWLFGHHEDLNEVRLVLWWVVSNGKSPSLSVLLRWLSFKAAKLIPSVIPEISRGVQF